MRRTTGRRGGDEGATAVEFAIVLPVVISVCFFALYGAMYFFYGAVADHVARTVARQVSIPVGETGSGYPDSNPGTVLGDARSAAGSLMPDPTSATSTGAAAEGKLVTVSVTYKLPLLSNLASVIPGMSEIDSVTRTASERRQ